MNIEFREALEALEMKPVEEKSIEIKEVTVKFNFTFEDGIIKDEIQSALYDMLRVNNAIIEESEAEYDANDSEDDEFKQI